MKEGDKAPSFTLKDQDGNEVKLADFKGKKVVLFFYPRADTPGCTAQACGFRDRLPVIEAGNATVLGLSPDLPEALAKWRAKEKLPYNLLSDPNHEVADAFGAWGEKSSYGRTYDGILRGHAIIGVDGRVEDLRVRIKPNESVEAAVEFLQSH